MKVILGTLVLVMFGSSNGFAGGKHARPEGVRSPASVVASPEKQSLVGAPEWYTNPRALNEEKKSESGAATRTRTPIHLEIEKAPNDGAGVWLSPTFKRSY